MVSVVIPVYNREKLILKSIQSVLNQTYSDLEIIVVDDGSTDNTREIVMGIDDPRVKYIYQKNSGACAARNKGVAYAVGKYIAFHDSDDVWFPDKLRTQVTVLDLQPQVDIVCCQTKCTKKNGNVFYSLENLKEGLISRSIGPLGISTQTLIMRSKVQKKVQFDTNVTRYQDLDFLITAHEFFEIYCVKQCLVEREIREDSITNHPERTYEMSGYLYKKHRKYFHTHQSLKHFFAGALMDAGYQISRKHGNPMPYFRRGLEFDSSVTSRLKLMGYMIHIYPLYRKIIER